ncbi:MAG: A/G-specific adenine glycosylase [Planctomycetota bacterium]|nr:A/G-specific adenine glycosylase [Planctomycetota bacterium]
MAKTTRVETRARALLLVWFEREKRALPWRETRDPFAIWVSEAMLQQTQVETVIPYFRRFLGLFPTVEALARAPLEDVLAAWSGLGYYRRARTLHTAARAIVESPGGRFPSTHAALLELPGVGPYTAGAVASIAFDEHASLVDGNVARVFARWFAIDSAQESKAFRDETWAIADRLVADVERPGEWNQALMELGATVCTPRDPQCDACPMRTGCRALATGRVAELPRPKVRRATIAVELSTFVVHENGTLVVRERASTERMAGLFELPTIETSGSELIAVRSTAPLRLAEIDTLGSVSHTITHHRIRTRVVSARVAHGSVEAPFRRVKQAEFVRLPLTGMTKKIVARGWANGA